MALSSSSADCSFAETYVRIALHELSALSSIYGRETAVQNALRVVERAWKTVPAAVRPPLSTFTAASFTYLWAETDERQNLPEGCVPLLCNPFVDYFDAPMYGDGIRSHYIVDGRVPTGYRAIPSVLFAPYIQTNPRRHLATRERINPIPIWFFNNTGRNDCFGVPVDGSCGGSIQLLCGDHKLEVLRHKTTLKLKFNVGSRSKPIPITDDPLSYSSGPTTHPPRSKYAEPTSHRCIVLIV
jgi:hypothetical protein